MWSMVLLLPTPPPPPPPHHHHHQSIHVQCPDGIISPLSFLVSIAHSTSTLPFIFLDLLWSPTTSHIIVSKAIIYTIPFSWLAHDSVKFPISSKIEPLSCVASKPFEPPCYGYTIAISTHFPSTNSSIRSHPFLSPLSALYIKFSLTTTPTPPICSCVPRQIHKIPSTDISSPSPFILVSANPITLISFSFTTSTANLKFLLPHPEC